MASVGFRLDGQVGWGESVFGLKAMVYVFIAVALFVAGFFWVRWLQRRKAALHRADTYVCPVCDEKDCVCHQRGSEPEQ